MKSIPGPLLMHHLTLIERAARMCREAHATMDHLTLLANQPRLQLAGDAGPPPDFRLQAQRMAMIAQAELSTLLGQCEVLLEAAAGGSDHAPKA